MLKIHLPAKEENVILVRLSQIQRDLYTQFMDRFRDCGSSGWLGLNPLKAFCVCCKVSGALREWVESKGAHKSWGRILVGTLGEGRLKSPGLSPFTALEYPMGLQTRHADRMPQNFLGCFLSVLNPRNHPFLLTFCLRKKGDRGPLWDGGFAAM